MATLGNGSWREKTKITDKEIKEHGAQNAIRVPTMIFMVTVQKKTDLS